MSFDRRRLALKHKTAETLRIVNRKEIALLVVAISSKP
jgi:hypothetical protein